MTIPNREPYKANSADIKKTLDYMGEKDKIFKATERVGKGIRTK